MPLAAQSRELPVPYSWPAKITSGTPSALVPHRGVVDRHLLAVGLVARHAALDARDHEVLDAHVGEGAARHDAVVAAARAVAVEVRRRDARGDCRYDARRRSSP